MGFYERVQRGTKWEDDVDNYIIGKGYIIAKHGYEYTHDKIQENIKEYKDINSKFIRYQPDRLAIDIKEETSFFYEPKNSVQIEKDAYLTYKSLCSIGCRVEIFIKNKENEKYRISIQDLKLISGRLSVKHMPHDWIHPPIDEDDWIAPRLWNDDKSEYYNPSKYNSWKNRVHGSGTPYKFFSFYKMKDYIINDFDDTLKLKRENEKEYNLFGKEIVKNKDVILQKKLEHLFDNNELS